MSQTPFRVAVKTRRKKEEKVGNDLPFDIEEPPPEGDDVEDDDGPQDAVEIPVHRVTAIAPVTSQFALMLANFSIPTSSDGRIGIDALGYFFSLFSPEDQRYLKRRAMDPEDPLDVEDLSDLMVHCIEEWAGRPTKQPSDFAPPSQNGGSRSTARRRGRG